MSRLSPFNSPFLLGFDQFERTIERIAKGGSEGFPPYNIEQVGEERLRITLAVAGFTAEDLSIQVEDNQLTIRGRQAEEENRVYLHRGIAGRQFQRSFVLADGMEVEGASLENGLLGIELRRPIAASRVRSIPIGQGSAKTEGDQVPVSQPAAPRRARP